jgi:hypothetical protein
MIYPEVCIDELCGFKNHFVDMFINMKLCTLVKIFV